MLTPFYLALIGVVSYNSSVFLALAKEIVETFLLLCKTPITLCLAPCEEVRIITSQKVLEASNFLLACFACRPDPQTVEIFKHDSNRFV